MNYINIIEGDLLNATGYIVHQCNCVSTNAQGIAKFIFDKYPYSNTYNNIKRIPGTISINQNIINMYAQYYPQKPKYDNDTTEKRIEWFKLCLNEITKYDIRELSMPYNIGCGLAGGDWNTYFNIISDFANHNQIYITLYKLK